MVRFKERPRSTGRGKPREQPEKKRSARDHLDRGTNVINTREEDK